MLNKNFSVLVYFLSTVLVLLLSIFVYRIITHISYDDFPEKITVSKFTVKRSLNIYSTINVKEYSPLSIPISYSSKNIKSNKT